MKLTHGLLLGLCLALSPTIASANDYISENNNDWFRYQSQTTGEEEFAQIQYVQGNWRFWSEFGGLGAIWVYSSSDSDNFWIWDGNTYQFVANLGGPVGSGTQTRLNDCNDGTVQVSARGSLTTRAGQFSNVTEISLDSRCSSQGVVTIWFARNVGVIGWVQRTSSGEEIFELSSASVDGTQYPSNSSAPSSDRAVAATEHADMETILWGCDDTYLVVDTYRDAFNGLRNSNVRSQVIVASDYVASQLRYEMSQAGVSLDNVEILTAALDSVWMRDYGPIVLKKGNGERVIADLDYYYERPRDDAIPRAYANYRGWDVVSVPLSFEGGNFATDGEGLAIASLGVQWFNRGMSTSQIKSQFAKMGCDQVLYLEPLIDEGTTHVDMFMRIMNDNQALVSRYPSWHRQSRVCNDAAAALQAAGYNVVRVDADHNYDEYATYSNSVLANGIALIPQYNSRSANQAALDAYRQMGFTPVAIDSKLIIKYSGATHCLSMQIPSGR